LIKLVERRPKEKRLETATPRIMAAANIKRPNFFITSSEGIALLSGRNGFSGEKVRRNVSGIVKSEQ
jgi:hypothetical protein